MPTPSRRFLGRLFRASKHPTHPAPIQGSGVVALLLLPSLALSLMHVRSCRGTNRSNAPFVAMNTESESAGGARDDQRNEAETHWGTVAVVTKAGRSIGRYASVCTRFTERDVKETLPLSVIGQRTRRDTLACVGLTHVGLFGNVDLTCVFTTLQVEGTIVVQCCTPVCGRLSSGPLSSN